MPYLLQAAFWVGVVGLVAALPLLCVLRVQGSYMSVVGFYWSSPAVVFLLASLTFSATYTLLPSNRWRSRIAATSAGVLTFFGFAIWMSIVVNVRTGNFMSPWPSMLLPFAAAFAIVGWLPLGGGWIAGSLVSKLPDTPVAEAT